MSYPPNLPGGSAAAPSTGSTAGQSLPASPLIIAEMLRVVLDIVGNVRSVCSIVDKQPKPMPCERKSRAARRRRMEIRKFKLVASSSVRLPVEISRKRLKVSDSNCNVARDCTNAVENSTSGFRVEATGEAPRDLDAAGDDTGRWQATATSEDIARGDNSNPNPNGSVEDGLQSGECEVRSDDSKSIEKKNGGVISSVDDAACPSHGMVSVCGRRREMEDAVSILPAFSSARNRHGEEHESPLHFFGVYDGHGGSQAALFCKERLHEVLAEEMEADGSSSSYDYSESQWQKVMRDCFLRVDSEVLGGVYCKKGCNNGERNQCCMPTVASETMGSTAVVAVVGCRQIIVANCGDSRAVLSRSGKAIALSTDHKPDRPDEMARIEAAGGRVIFWNGHRVLGVLAMSRAIGDKYLKPYVVAEPEVTCTQRTDEDECLILASDGLWDVLSNEVVCEVARRCLSGRVLRNSNGFFPFSDGEREESPSAVAAAFLTKLALARGSCDNISVVVVDLKKHPR
eukprot:Gb_27731 [translate_table: standard]